MTLEEAFPLTSDEAERVRRLPSTGSADDWREVASRIQENLLVALAEDEITFKRFMMVTRATCLGCTAKDRITLLGIASERGLTAKKVRPRPRGLAKRPVYPTALKYVAVDLVEHIKAISPGANLEPCIELAVRWLEVFGLFGKAPNARTLHNWYMARRAQQGRSSPRGRPSKAKIH